MLYSTNRHQVHVFKKGGGFQEKRQADEQQLSRMITNDGRVVKSHPDRRACDERHKVEDESSTPLDRHTHADMFV